MVSFAASIRLCHPLLFFLAFLALVQVALPLALAQPEITPQLTLLDGVVQPAPELKLENGKLTAAELPAGLTLDDLRLIVTPADKSPLLPSEAAYVVDLAGGGSIKATQVTIADDQCTISWSGGDPLKVSIDVVRAIRFQPNVASDEFAKSRAAPSADLDRVFVKIDGKIDSLTGLVNGLTADKLAFEIDGQIRDLPRDRVFGIVVALAAPESRLPRCTFHLNEGSLLGGDLLTLSGGKAVVLVAAGSKVVIPWTSIRRVEVRSGRVLYLSDLKPTLVKQHAIVTLPRPWQKDRSVTGKMLTLGGKAFEKGIGVHAHNELTFDVPEEFDELAATVGIDASAGGKGDCLFEIHVDSQRVWNQRLRGSDAPQELKVPLRNAKQITLVVLPGAELDLADHADWADVRLLKNKP